MKRILLVLAVALVMAAMVAAMAAPAFAVGHIGCPSKVSCVDAGLPGDPADPADGESDPNLAGASLENDPNDTQGPDRVDVRGGGGGAKVINPGSNTDCKGPRC